MDLSNFTGGDHLIVYNSVTGRYESCQISAVTDYFVYVHPHGEFNIIILDKFEGLSHDGVYKSYQIVPSITPKNTNPCGWKIYQPDTNT